jgi:AcrR family transcriptional regulator
VPQLHPSHVSHPLLKITSSAQLELRGRILAAAKQRFARFSREDTTLADIARLAHLEVDDVEEHFEDTQELLVAVQRSMDRGRASRRPNNRPGRHGFAARNDKSVRSRETQAAEA